MKNLNPLFLFLESKQYRKIKYGSNLKKAEDTIRHAAETRKMIDKATDNYSPSKKWIGDNLRDSPLGKSLATDDRNKSLKVLNSDRTTKKLKGLVDKEGVRKFKSGQQVKKMLKLGSKLIK